MRNITDATLNRYAEAAATLPASVIRDVIEYAERVAPHVDDAAGAVPHVVIALADAGGPRDSQHARALTRSAVRDATRARLRAETSVSPVAEVPDAPAPPMASPTPSWESVRVTLPAADRAMLDALASDGIARVIRDRARTHRTLPDGHTVGDVVDAPITGERRALRVGVIASAIGVPAPRTRDASDALRAGACVAWGRASVAVGTARRVRVPVPSTGTAPRWAFIPESVAERAVRAMRYVTTDAAALGAAWRADRDLVGGATLGTVSPAMTRRLGWVAPVADPVSGSLTRSLPEPRKGAARRSRKGVSVPSTSARYAGGIAAGSAHGAIVAGISTDAGILAHVRAARAAALHDALTGATADPIGRNRCARPTDDGRCGCGGAMGATLWEGCHPLTPCPEPTDRRGRMSCGCGRKRGALAEHGGAWHHRAR